MPSEDSPRKTIAMVPGRLGAPEIIPGPKDLHPLVQLALDWQQYGYSARTWEAFGMKASQVRQQRGRLYVIAGCMAGVGEQLGLAAAAELEYRSWLSMTTVRDAIEAEMGKRAMAELAVHYLVAINHGLFNIACRCVALDVALHAELARRIKSTFPPFSETRRDWPTASSDRVKSLEQIAKSSSVAEIQQSVEPLATFLQSPEWRQLDDCRGENFHRWRAQSAGMTGAAKKSPWEDSQVASSIHLGADLLGVDGVGTLAADTMDTAARGRELLVPTMRQFEQRLFAVIEATTGVTFGQDS
jgi:hypothetical protein